MYSIRDNMAYQGCLCPGCSNKGIQEILYIRGSEDFMDKCEVTVWKK